MDKNIVLFPLDNAHIFQMVNSDIYAIASQIKLQGTFKLNGSIKIISSVLYF